MPLLLGELGVRGGDAGTLIAAAVVFFGALAAIMSTADSVLLSAGLADRRRGSARWPRAPTSGADAALGKRIAAGRNGRHGRDLRSSARDVTLWGLIELKMELLIQCVPAFFVALRWPGLRAGPAAAGLFAGTAIAVAGALLGAKRIEGFHIGVIGLAVNLAVALLGSLALRDRPAGSSRPVG